MPHWLGATGSGLWQFNADLHLIDWLETKGFNYDVITDEDLHAEGCDLLKRYRVVLTGIAPRIPFQAHAGRAAGLHRSAAAG